MEGVLDIIEVGVSDGVIEVDGLGVLDAVADIDDVFDMEEYGVEDVAAKGTHILMQMGSLSRSLPSSQTI